MKPRRRHYKLNADVIEKVRVLAEYGAALEHIAPAVGVSYASLKTGFLTQKATILPKMNYLF